MSGRIKIKPKNKDKNPKIDIFKVIEGRFKNMNELRDLIDMDQRKGLVRIREKPKITGGGGRAGDARKDGSQLLLLANAPPSMSSLEYPPPTCI